MTTQQSLDDLIAVLEHTIEAGLAHFRQLEAAAKIPLGKIGPRETLCHLVWWHQASTEGMESVGSGGAPYRIYASTQEMNARAVGRLSGQTVSQLLHTAQQWHGRLVTAARAVANPETTVFVQGSGKGDTVRQRIEAIIEHWESCIQELQAV